MKKIWILSIFLMIYGSNVARTQTAQTPQPGQTLQPGQTPQPGQTTVMPGMPKIPTPPMPPQIMMPQAHAMMGMMDGGYTDTTIGGWKIKISNKLTDGHRLMTAKALQILSTELGAVEKKLPSDAVPYLKEMNIWIEFSTPNNQPVQYHLSAEWLARNGYDPRKESSVEVVAIDYVNLDRESIPLLQPFAAAYHQRVLGLNNRSVLAAYDHARHIREYGDTSTSHAIIFHDANEYFAAISAAYFGETQAPPYNRSKLKSEDSEGYALVEKFWKIKN